MGRKYFGTDGIRGKVGSAPITPDFVLRLAMAAGKVLVAEGPQRVRELASIGARFDTDTRGKLSLGKEAAHSRHRIVHAHLMPSVGEQVGDAVAHEPGADYGDDFFILRHR